MANGSPGNIPDPQGIVDPSAFAPGFEPRPPVINADGSITTYPGGLIVTYLPKPAGGVILTFPDGTSVFQAPGQPAIITGPGNITGGGQNGFRPGPTGPLESPNVTNTTGMKPIHDPTGSKPYPNVTTPLPPRPPANSPSNTGIAPNPFPPGGVRPPPGLPTLPGPVPGGPTGTLRPPRPITPLPQPQLPPGTPTQVFGNQGNTPSVNDPNFGVPGAGATNASPPRPTGTSGGVVNPSGPSTGPSGIPNAGMAQELEDTYGNPFPPGVGHKPGDPALTPNTESLYPQGFKPWVDSLISPSQGSAIGGAISGLRPPPRPGGIGGSFIGAAGVSAGSGGGLTVGPIGGGGSPPGG